MASRIPRRRARYVAVLSAAAFWLCSGVASAEFVPVAAPCPGGGIVGFAASGSTWLVSCLQGSGSTQTTTLARSPDRGATWQPVPWPADPSVPTGRGIATGPDGAFYLAVRSTVEGTGDAGRLLRVDTAGAVTTLPGSLPVPGGLFTADISAPVFVAGAPVVAYTLRGAEGPRVVVVRRADDGSWQRVTDPVAGPGPPQLHLFGNDLYLRAGPRQPIGWQQYRLVGSAFVEADAIPSYRDGDVVASPDWVPDAGGIAWQPAGISQDGGRTWQRGSAPTGVEGAADLLVMSGGAGAAGSWQILRRVAVGAFHPTGLTVAPPGGRPGELGARIIAVDGGLVAVTDQSRFGSATSEAVYGYLAFHAGAPPAVGSHGTLSPLFTRWLARANEFRAQAGLPPMYGDERMSLAAERHSRYWTMNRLVGDPLGIHKETPGTPGFSGADPAQRCAAAGTTCGWEVAGSGIDGWAATPYHRAFVVQDALIAGGAQVGAGPAIMNWQRLPSFSLQTVKFPNGAYDGHLGFEGESPDPGQRCTDPGVKLLPPYGAAVTFAPPGRIVSIAVALDGKSVPGCLLMKEPTFLPSDPLRPRSTYTATATWRETTASPLRTDTWTFTTGDGNGGPASTPCAPKLGVAARSRRRGQKLVLTYRTCERTRLTMVVRGPRQRRGSRRSTRPVVRRITRTIPAAKQGRVELSTRRMKLGAHRVEAALFKGSKRVRKLTASVAIRKAKRPGGRRPGR